MKHEYVLHLNCGHIAHTKMTQETAKYRREHLESLPIEVRCGACKRVTLVARIPVIAGEAEWAKEARA